MTHRHRTFWIIRQRFHRAQWLAALLGAGLIAWIAVPALPGGISVIASLTGAALSWLLVGALWRAYRRRRYDEWTQPVTSVQRPIVPAWPQRPPAAGPELADRTSTAPERPYELVAAIAGQTSPPP